MRYPSSYFILIHIEINYHQGKEHYIGEKFLDCISEKTKSYAQRSGRRLKWEERFATVSRNVNQFSPAEEKLTEKEMTDCLADWENCKGLCGYTRFFAASACKNATGCSVKRNRPNGSPGKKEASGD